MTRRPLRAIAPLLAALVLSACGTTVSGPTSSATSDARGVAAPDGDVGDATGATGLTTAGIGGQAGADGAATAAAGGSVAGDGPVGDVRAVGPGTAGPAARGDVKVGFFITDDASAIYKSLGISGASHTRTESKAIWGAVVDQVNARGGLAGRRIVPSWSFIDSESGSNASRAQAACDYFTQDVKVAAVVIDGATDVSMAACLAKRRTPVIDVGQTSYPYDDADLRALAPYLYLPGRLSMSRFTTYVDRLEAAGFFGKGSKVGLLRFDLPNQARTARDVIAPALARHGHALDVDFAFTPVEGTRDLPRAANEASAAVLRLRAKGVDRVLFLGSGLSLPFVFPTTAESNGYRPRYGITSDDGPDFMATNAPAAQMTGAVAVGWEPQYDVADSDAVLKGSATWRECAAVMRKAGFPARDGRRCTAVYFLEQALRGAPGFSPGLLRQGVDRLGAAAYSTQTYATSYGPRRFDGVSAVRVLRFDSACTCFRYVTGNITAP